GYKMLHGKAEIVEKDAETVKLAFQLVAENKKALGEINAILMSKGYLGFNHPMQIHRIIKNRFYIGEITRNNEWFKGIHEPIVSEELFMLANSRFSKTSAKPKRASLFSGKVICGICGKKMSMQPSNKRVGGKIVLRRFARCQSQRMTQKCSNKMKAQTIISRALITNLQKFALENAISIKKESIIIARDFEKELQSIENQRMKVLDLYARDLMPDHLLDKKLETLSKQEAEIILSQKEYTDSLVATTHEEKLAAAKELLELANDDFENVDKSRELLDVLIDRIVVTFDEIDFFWK
ncbi:MAG: recombinase family protein, partial [Culicoidibacterales bacterium]